MILQEPGRDLKYDNITKTIYSTDASVYKEEPVAVVWPKE